MPHVRCQRLPCSWPSVRMAPILPGAFRPPGRIQESFQVVRVAERRVMSTLWPGEPYKDLVPARKNINSASSEAHPALRCALPPHRARRSARTPLPRPDTRSGHRGCNTLRLGKKCPRRAGRTTTEVATASPEASLWKGSFAAAPGAGRTESFPRRWPIVCIHTKIGRAQWGTARGTAWASGHAARLHAASRFTPLAFTPPRASPAREPPPARSGPRPAG
jgi:hypothetical protein